VSGGIRKREHDALPILPSGPGIVENFRLDAGFINVFSGVSSTAWGSWLDVS
jgi:hypothetical protein